MVKEKKKIVNEQWNVSAHVDTTFSTIVEEAKKTELLDDKEIHYPKKKRVTKQLKDWTSERVYEKQETIVKWTSSVIKKIKNWSNIDTLIKISDGKNIVPWMKNDILRNMKVLSVGQPKEIDRLMYDLNIKRWDNK